MSNKPSKPFETHKMDFLQDPGQVALYLEEAYEEGGEELLQIALKTVAKAQDGGVAGVAKAAGLDRTNLYRALSKGGKPKRETLYKMIEALGYRPIMKFIPIETSHA